MRRFLQILLTLALCGSLTECGGGGRGRSAVAAPPAAQTAPDRLERYGCQPVAEYPHDEGAYTQGLFFHGGKLYESAGQYGESSLRIVDLETGRVLKRRNFDRKYFLEGACVLDGRLYVITWRENLCFVCDPQLLETLATLRYRGEGWGLTTDGKSLIMSDGSAVIRYRDPKTFAVEREFAVRYNGRELNLLNELEYVDGHIWANVYGSSLLVCIDPETGRVTEQVDCRGLLPDSLRKPATDVFNGIAYDAADGGFYVTGKYWPRLYRIRKTK